VDSQAFSTIIGSMDRPMAVVTTAVGDKRAGCLVGFHTECSIDPHHWLVCISKVNETYRVVRAADALVLHLLRADQLDLARLFGEATGDDVDKFARCSWSPGPHGVPVLDGCDWFGGPILDRFDCGDHEGQLVAIMDAGAAHVGGAQLGFQQVRGLHPGHPA
jgi:flavin reductase (DIM6/NTAB) family NADH-FMN oxidoreductase RutF